MLVLSWVAVARFRVYGTLHDVAIRAKETCLSELRSIR
jgi:hypothetical protein